MCYWPYFQIISTFEILLSFNIFSMKKSWPCIIESDFSIISLAFDDIRMKLTKHLFLIFFLSGHGLVYHQYKKSLTRPFKAITMLNTILYKAHHSLDQQHPSPTPERIVSHKIDSYH